MDDSELTPQTYRSKPVAAVRVDGNNVDDVIAWLRENGTSAFNRDGAVSMGHTTADRGEWVVVPSESFRVQVYTDEAYREEFDVTPIRTAADVDDDNSLDAFADWMGGNGNPSLDPDALGRAIYRFRRRPRVS